MKVTAKIVNPNDTKEIYLSDILLNDIPTSENCVIINGENFIVIHTLFYSWNEGSCHYQFEQKIKRNDVVNDINIKVPPISLPFILLIGEVEFEENETKILFKEIKLKPENHDSFNKYKDLIKVPYPYLRAFDLVEIKNGIFVCWQITVIENIEVRVDFSMSPMTVDQFREDKQGFLRNTRR